MKKSLFVLYLLCFFFISCENKFYYEEYVRIPNNEWDINSEVKFKVPIDNVDNTYSIFINIDHDKKYQYNNLWLFIKTTAPNGNFQLDTLNCYFTDENYYWTGKQKGDYLHFTTSFADSVKFMEAGDYIFEIQHGLRQDKVNMINRVGLIIQKN